MRLAALESLMVEALARGEQFIPELERIYTLEEDYAGRFYMVVDGELFKVDIARTTKGEG